MTDITIYAEYLNYSKIKIPYRGKWYRPWLLINKIERYHDGKQNRSTINRGTKRVFKKATNARFYGLALAVRYNRMMLSTRSKAKEMLNYAD